MKAKHLNDSLSQLLRLVENNGLTPESLDGAKLPPHLCLRRTEQGLTFTKFLEPEVGNKKPEDVCAILSCAASLFQGIPMPLEACLALRDLLRRRHSFADVLFPYESARASKGSALSIPELASLLNDTELGTWALAAPSIEFLVTEARRLRPKAVLEFGCGVSTIVLAWLMRELYGTPSQPVVFSIEQSDDFLRTTETRLRTLGLMENVRLLHAPMMPQNICNISIACYRLPEAELAAFLGDARPDFVLIDGPAGSYGSRFGTVPLVHRFLQEKAAIYMDDALRDSELAIADCWNMLRYVQIAGIVWAGKGFLIGNLAALPNSDNDEARDLLARLLGVDNSRVTDVSAT